MRIERSWDIVVVGAGIAGVCAATEARRVAPGARILLLNGEDRLPYKRTKLSKSIASGFERDAFALKPEDDYAQGALSVRHGVRVGRIDLAGHGLELADGSRVDWGTLVLATGARPLRTGLFPEDTAGVHVVREAEEAESLIADLSGATSVLVVGLGVLGVELAEQMSKLGLAVTAVHRGARLMERDLTPRASARLLELFRSHGIEPGFGVEISAGRVLPDGRCAVTLSGREQVFDRVVECVGSVPNTGLAARAGLRVGRGIVVDESLQTSHAGVYAAGDVVEFDDGGLSHLWHAAEFQGTCAGANAAGERRRYDRRPFRLKCEVFGSYFFSMAKPAGPVTEGMEIDETDVAGVYRCFYYRAGRLAGAVMEGDGERAKAYEKAVLEHWPRERVAAELGPAAVSPGAGSGN